MAKHSAAQSTTPTTGVVPVVVSTATAYTDRLRGSSLQRSGRHAR